MRRDIQVNTQIGDIVLSNRNSLTACSFEWQEESDVYLFGRIILPVQYDIKGIYTKGVLVEIPYTPRYKRMRIEVCRTFGTATYQAVRNPVDHSRYFNLKTKYLGGADKTFYAPQLLMIDEDKYVIQLVENSADAYVWASSDSDLNNVKASIQNRNLLLKCVPSNNYRYPTSGVGLVRYLHSALSQSDLANRLQDEFKNDKVMVNSAAFNSYTGDIDLDLDFTEADASV